MQFFFRSEFRVRAIAHQSKVIPAYALRGRWVQPSQHRTHIQEDACLPNFSACDSKQKQNVLPLKRLSVEACRAWACILAAWSGRGVLIHIWATWCPACLQEIPPLNRPQATFGGPRFEVVALSKHVAGAGVVQAFFRRAAIRHLRQYPDAFGQSSRNWATAGIPLTPLVDLR